MWGNDKTEKLDFRKDEVIAYLEELIIDDLATEEELILYENFHWFNKLDRSSITYKKVVYKMKKQWNGE